MDANLLIVPALVPGSDLTVIFGYIDGIASRGVNVRAPAFRTPQRVGDDNQLPEAECYGAIEAAPSLPHHIVVYG